MDLNKRDEEAKILLVRSQNPIPKYCNQFYTHWLPKTRVFENISDANYEEFQYLVHATHIHDAGNIIHDQKISARPIDDSTVANCNLVPFENDSIPSSFSCLATCKGIWLAPNCSMSHRFGPLVFNLAIQGWEGIIRNPNDFHYYWIETIDYYKTQSASRIIASRKELIELQAFKYNPTVKGGPWYWKEARNTHYALKEIKGYNGSNRDHTLEFIKLQDLQTKYIRSWTTIPHNNCKKRSYVCKEIKHSKYNSALFFLAHNPQITMIDEKWFVKYLQEHLLVRNVGLEDESNDFLERGELDWQSAIACLKDQNYVAAIHCFDRIPSASLKEKFTREFDFRFHLDV